MTLVMERFLWSTMCQDVNNWVKSCESCKKAKGSYNYPNVKQGLLIANCPLPTRIYSDKGKSFDNGIIHHLCIIYGVKTINNNTI